MYSRPEAQISLATTEPVDGSAYKKKGRKKWFRANKQCSVLVLVGETKERRFQRLCYFAVRFVA